MKEYILHDYGKEYDNDSFGLSILLYYTDILVMVICLISTVYSVYCNYNILFLINYICFCINFTICIWNYENYKKFLIFKLLRTLPDTE